MLSQLQCCRSDLQRGPDFWEQGRHGIPEVHQRPPPPIPEQGDVRMERHDVAHGHRPAPAGACCTGEAGGGGGLHHAVKNAPARQHVAQALAALMEAKATLEEAADER